MIHIEVSSNFEELWRYNIFAMCGGYDSAGERLYVKGDEMVSSETVETGVIILPPPPVGFTPESMTLSLECDDAERLEIIVYVVAHLLPEDRDVDNSPPFDCQIKIRRDKKEIYNKLHKVNQWGGMTTNINL